MISRLPKPVLDRIFHIRSQSEKTWIEQFWQPIDGSKFNPDKKSPLSGVDGRGDGTVPFWSARLAQTPPSQVYAVKNKVEHQEMLEHSEVLQAIRRIIETGKHSYFTAVGEDMAIRAKLPDGQLWEYRFFFGDCWFDQPAGESQHTFNIEEEPLAGIPVEICP
jgi:hypothetical protein